jgi:hypothetical protein
VLGPELGRDADGQARAERDVDDPLIDALGVQVDLERPAGAVMRRKRVCQKS